MSITHIYTQNIRRAGPSEPIRLHNSEKDSEPQGLLADLCRDLKASYLKKLGKQYGRFADDTSQHPLSAWLKSFLDQQLTFASTCQKAGEQLKQVLEATEEPLDATILCFVESLEAGQFIYWFWLNHSGGIYLDGALEACETRYIDTQSVRLAARANLSEWQSASNSHYLTLIPWRGEKPISDAFSEFIGFADKVDTKSQTEQLMSWVDHYSKPLPEDNAKAVRAAAAQYCIEQTEEERPVRLEALSEHISADQEHNFANFVQKDQPNVKKEWLADKTQLRNFVRISGRNEQLSMSFSANCLGQTVVYQPETDTIVINNIPAGLKTRLMRHLQKGGKIEADSGETKE